MIKKFEQPNCASCGSRKHSVFCELHGQELTELNDDKGCVFYKKGQIIFNAGQNPQGIYCVHEGKIKVYQVGDEGKEQIVRLAKGGDILGYRSLLGGGKYSSTAETLDDSKICFIPKKTFINLLESNGTLSMLLMKLLSIDLKVAEHRMTDLAQKPVRERVAEAILYLKQTYGLETDGETISIALSREDIANIVGTATETTIRLLAEFKQDGIIRLDGKKIAILKPVDLLKVANVTD